MTTKSPPWRYALCNEMYEDWPLDKVAASAAEIGYEGLELAPFTLCDYVTDLSLADRKQIRQTIESAGLAVVGLHWLLAKTEGLQLNDTDPSIREKTAQYMLALIDCCADVGGEVLIFGSPQQRDVHPEYSREEAWKSTVEIMHRCGERASERGVTFCVEPLSTNETDFIVNVSEAAQLVQDVDHPGFQMMVDCKAMFHTPIPIPEQIKSVHPLFQHVHVNDPNLLGPGMGDVDFKPILGALDDLQFSQWLSVEVFDFSLGAERIARESLANLKAACP
ncbi:MAG: sugar phosphate isomerase/epimerase family protein [Chloroflexota bacterium]